MTLELRSAYWDDVGSREAFEAFVLEIHGLDFGDWRSGGFWDDAYTPFSYFEGDRVVASVCLYQLDFVVRGRPTRLVQVSGVGTLPAYRRRGLNRELTEIGLATLAGTHEGVFLFSDADAVGFYERCGFAPTEEFLPVAPLRPVERLEGATRIDPTRRDHVARLYKLAGSRAPVSREFGVLSPRLLMFHALRPLRSDGWFVEPLGCAVFARRVGDRLKLFDVVGPSVPTFAELYPHLTAPGDRWLEVHFPTDALGLEDVSLEPLRGNHPFLRGELPFERIVFPFTCRA